MKRKQSKKKIFVGFLMLVSLTLGGCRKIDPHLGDEKYQIYLKATAAGFTGTYEEWLASLKGDPGAQGPKGDTGDKGDKGDPGAQGPKGDTGDKGDKGDTGAQGPKGDTGDSESTKTFRISFNTGGGSEVASQSINFGGKISEPVSERENYILDGWYLDDEKWLFSIYHVFEDLTLTAKWISKYVTVNFDPNVNARLGNIPAEVFAIGEPFELPNFIHPVEVRYQVDWYTVTEFRKFDGWTYNGNLITDEVWTIREDVTLIGQWSKIVNEVDPDDEPVYLAFYGFIPDDNEPIFGDYLTVYDYNFDDVVELINEGKLPFEYPLYGYEIKLTYLGKEITDLTWWDQTYSIRIDYQFTPNTYHFTLDYNGGITDEETEYEFTATFGEDDFRIPTPYHPDEYEFIGWFYEDINVINYYYSEWALIDWEVIGNINALNMNLKAVFDIPIDIERFEDLTKLRERPFGTFNILSDLDFTGIDWEPIPYFSGQIHGNDHAIIGLTFTEPSIYEEYGTIGEVAGLFTIISDSYIHGLRFEQSSISIDTDSQFVVVGLLAAAVLNSSLNKIEIDELSSVELNGNYQGYDSSSNMAGGLVGNMSNVNLTNVKNAASVTGNNAVGGIAASLSGRGHLENVVNTGNIKGEYGVGGIIGITYANMNSVSAHFVENQGNIEGESHVGGIIGHMEGYEGNWVRHSSNNGNVKGHDKVGGLVGFANYVTIDNSYNKGTVEASYQIGGLIGGIRYNGTILQSFNLGELKGNDTIGGLLGDFQWDQDLVIIRSFNSGNITVILDGSEWDKSIGQIVAYANLYESNHIENIYFSGTILDSEGQIVEPSNTYGEAKLAEEFNEEFLKDTLWFEDRFWDFSTMSELGHPILFYPF